MHSSKRGMTAFAALLALPLAFAATSATAGARVADRTYTDSFGNLVIVSPAGYKRIIVGGGASSPREVTRPRQERIDGVIYFDRPDEATKPKVYRGHSSRTSGYRVPRYSYRCVRGAMVVRGRSYMYGIGNAMPVLANQCQ